jgi:hypothetical protein
MDEARMKTTFTVLFLIGSMLTACDTAGEEEPLVKFTLECPPVWVESYPMIIRVRIEKTRNSFDGDWYGVPGIGLELLGGVGQDLEINCKNEKDEVQNVGYPGLGTPTSERGQTPINRANLKLGDSAVLVFDISQLTFTAQDYGEKWRWLPGPGKWLVRYCYRLDECSNEAPVTIRRPSVNEEKIANALNVVTDRTRSWFPNLIFSDKQIPDTAGLPDETRSILEFIRALRAAVEKPKKGLDTIAKAEKDGVKWGFLAPNIDGLRYECLMLAQKPEDAEKLKKAKAEDKTALDLIHEVDMKRGVVSLLMAAKSKKE